MSVILEGASASEDNGVVVNYVRLREVGVTVHLNPLGSGVFQFLAQIDGGLNNPAPVSTILNEIQTADQLQQDLIHGSAVAALSGVVTEFARIQMVGTTIVITPRTDGRFLFELFKDGGLNNPTQQQLIYSSVVNP